MWLHCVTWTVEGTPQNSGCKVLIPVSLCHLSAQPEALIWLWCGGSVLPSRGAMGRLWGEQRQHSPSTLAVAMPTHLSWMAQHTATPASAMERCREVLQHFKACVFAPSTRRAP